jgi:colicin import membrane protein
VAVPFGLTVSILLHGGALLWMYLAMISTPPLKAPEPAPIEVALITPSDLLALKKGSTTATELEAKAKDEPKPEMSKLEAEKPKPILAPELPVEPTPPPVEEKKVETPPPEPPKAEPEPKKDPIAEKLAALPVEQPPPGPTPDELKKIEEDKKAEELRQTEEVKKQEEAEKKKKEDEAKKKKAEEEKKKKEEERKKKLAEQKRKEQEKKKKQQQADRLAALLDKDPTRKGAPNSATPPENPTDYTGPTAGAAEGNAPRLSVREQDLLRSQISAQLRQCWKLPGGGGGIETIVVTVRWKLFPDGRLDGEPMLEAPQSGPVYQIAAEAAVRAVKACSPFTLPQDRYWAWKSIIWDFDPREML